VIVWPLKDAAGTLDVPGGDLRVLMVISRPTGIRDVGYQMVARPLLERLDAVRGQVNLTVLRPPTFDALDQAVRQAAEADDVGAGGDRLDHIGAAADAAIDHDLGAAAHRIDDLRQHMH